jgi:hypothetical protein
MSLNNQSGRLADLGRREDALAAIEEAVTAYRELAATRPTIYVTRLKSSLKLMADALATVGRRPETDAISAVLDRLC